MNQTPQFETPMLRGFDLDAARAAFPALSECTYFNFGARGVMAQATIDAISRSLTTLQSAGPASRIGAALLRREDSALRQALATRRCVQPEEIQFCSSVSQAVSLGFAGLQWNDSDVLVVGEGEPPGTWLWARELVRRHGIELRSVPRPYGGPAFFQALSRQLCGQTRLVVLSHVDWVTGDVVNLNELVAALRGGAARDAVLVVDGAQAAGAQALDLSRLEIDVYALTAQKWFGGPDGLAAAVLRGGRLRPSQIGWRAIDPQAGDDLHLASGAAAFGAGSLPVALMPGWRAALEIADQQAPPEVRFARIQALSGCLRKALNGLAAQHDGMRLLGEHAQTGIVAFTVPQDRTGTVKAALSAQGFVVRALHWPACLRICVHYLTRDSEIDRLVETLPSILARGSLTRN